MTARNFEISVAAWSFHREIFSNRLTLIDTVALVREELDLGALELVNTLFEVPTARYVDKFAARAEEQRVTLPLLMCDGEGDLGAADLDERALALRNHQKWIWIAADLGCGAIRVNWKGWKGDEESVPIDDLIERSRATFSELVQLGMEHHVDILVENHGGPSSDPDLLVRLMEAVDSPHFGTLPDFGNFPEGTDIYAAVDAMMPWAGAVSAKCYDFGSNGEETSIDFERMLEICIDQHGYTGFIGVEFEGDRLPEREGTRACRDLLTRLRE